jgi:SAM-dependent methyltransferase
MAGPVADVAARTEPEIAWRRGDAASLPFEEATFDVVVSQFALMYFPDRVASLREMWRTLAPGAAFRWPLGADRSRPRLPDPGGYRRPTMRAWAADVLAAPFVLGDQVELAKLFVDSGISGAKVSLHEGSIRFPSVKEFIRIEVKGSPLAEMLSDMEIDAGRRGGRRERPVLFSASPA